VEPIKLKKLIEVLQSAYDKHKDNPRCADSIKVEFWLEDEWVELSRIGQFGVVPDVTITLKRLPERLPLSTEKDAS
jgi:hypothetical protein